MNRGGGRGYCREVAAWAEVSKVVVSDASSSRCQVYLVIKGRAVVKVVTRSLVRAPSRICFGSQNRIGRAVEEDCWGLWERMRVET